VSDAASSAAAPDAARPSIDRAAVLRGAGAALIVAVPAGFAQRAVSTGSSLKGLLLLVILAGFGWGGAVAAKAAPDERPLTHGAVAGALAVAAYLVILVAARLVMGDPVPVVSLAFVALIAVSCGIVGAELGSRQRRNRAASDDDASDDGADQ
jgi:alpha-beta hydrolase superfamily lysophospholipase